MLLDQLRTVLAMPHKLALMRLQKLVRSQAELLHTNALLESGIADALREWRSFEDLIAALGSTRPEYVGHVLELGVSLGSIERQGERYRASGRLLKAVIEPDGAPIASLLREFSHYHSRMLRELPAQIEGAAAPDYLADYGELVAGASRISEPFMEVYVDELSNSSKPLRILEIGCGSGVYLQRYGRANPQHHGIAIDFSPAVAVQARDNVKAWGLDDRFQVLEADARKPGPELDGPFDLITSFQNIYYFSRAERLELFRSAYERLAPDGSFAIVTATSSKGFMFRYYDVLLNGTAGCHSLPTSESLLEDLDAAGFERSERTRLLSGPGAIALRSWRRGSRDARQPSSALRVAGVL